MLYLDASALVKRYVEEPGSDLLHAAELSLLDDLRSIDALHLAAALLLPREGLVIATWDRRLHAAARRRGLGVLPDGIPAS